MALNIKRLETADHPCVTYLADEAKALESGAGNDQFLDKDEDRLGQKYMDEEVKKMSSFKAKKLLNVIS